MLVVFVVQFVFKDGRMDAERLKQLVDLIGKERLVLDLSCRKKVKQHVSHCAVCLSCIAYGCLQTIDQDERQTEMQDALHDVLKYLVLHSMWLQHPFCICDYVHIS